MEYGNGTMIFGDRKYCGEVVIDTKLYLNDPAGRPIVDTFIPIEKIESMQIAGSKLEIKVFPSVVSFFTAYISMDRRRLKLLAKDLARTGNLRKRFLLNQWQGDVYIG